MNVETIGNLGAPTERRVRKPRIMVAGEFSSGKTRLINGLIGADVLPSNVTATALPPVWIFGAAKCLFRVDLQGQRYEINSLAEAKVEDTAFCAMSHSSPFLKNFDVIDTPGNSDPNIPSESWERMLQLADVLIWCTNATQAWRQSEKSAWSLIPPHLKKNSLLLISHSDRLPDDVSAEKVMRRVRRHLDNEFTSIVMASLVDEEHLASIRQHVSDLFLDVEDLAGAAQPDVEDALLKGKFSGLAEKLVEVSRSLANKSTGEMGGPSFEPTGRPGGPNLSVVKSEPDDAVASAADEDLASTPDDALVLSDADRADAADDVSDEIAVDEPAAAEAAPEPVGQLVEVDGPDADEPTAEADTPAVEVEGEDAVSAEAQSADAEVLDAGTVAPADETIEPDADEDVTAADAIEEAAETDEQACDLDTPLAEEIEPAADPDIAEPAEPTSDVETSAVDPADRGDDADAPDADVIEPAANTAPIADDQPIATSTAKEIDSSPTLARDVWNMLAFGADMSDPDELLACIEAAITEIDHCLALRAPVPEQGLDDPVSEVAGDEAATDDSADEDQQVKGEG